MGDVINLRAKNGAGIVIATGSQRVAANRSLMRMAMRSVM
jgi:hypothetical protein